MIDERADLSGFELVQLPDSVVVTPMLAIKLRSYYEAGGRLLISYRAGFDAAGNWALDFLPLSFGGKWGKPVEKYPTYWRTRQEMRGRLGHADRVCYLPGIEVTGRRGTRVLVERVLPYFQRTDATFSSHMQAPPMAEADPSPAVVRESDSCISRTRFSGNSAKRESADARRLARRDEPARSARSAFRRRIADDDHVIPRRRGNDLIVTLLHYIPTRKTLEMDMIEERSGFAGERLRLPAKVREARVFGGATLKQDERREFDAFFCWRKAGTPDRSARVLA